MRKMRLISKGAMAAALMIMAQGAGAREFVHPGLSYTDDGQYNNTIVVDGRKAHDLALLYRLTDDRRFADEALKHINRYNNLTNVSIRGTGPLDGGKIYLLIERP